MNREPDGLGLVGQGTLDGLLDPPGAVGGELAALGGVEAFDTLHQAHVALVDQVQKGEAQSVVVLGDFHHQPEIGSDHVLPGHGVTAFDPGCECIFLGHREQWNLDRLPHVQVQGALGFVDLSHGFGRVRHHRNAVDDLNSGPRDRGSAGCPGLGLGDFLHLGRGRHGGLHQRLLGRGFRAIRRGDSGFGCCTNRCPGFPCSRALGGGGVLFLGFLG